MADLARLCAIPIALATLALLGLVPSGTDGPVTGVALLPPWLPSPALPRAQPQGTAEMSTKPAAVVVRVLLKAKSGERPRALSLLSEDAKTTRALPGCARFEVTASADDEATVLLYEEWQDAESFRAYTSSERFAAIGQQVFALLEDKPDSAYFDAAQFGP